MKFSILGGKVEQFTWSTYNSPFHWTIWLCLLSSTFIVSIALWLFHSFQSEPKNLSLIEAVCIASSSIFGMVIWNAHEFNSNESGRLTLFTVFLTGSLFYYTYVGFLTSSLAVPNENIPFQSPEEIPNTNYRY